MKKDKIELSKMIYQDNQINPPNPFYKVYPYIPFNPFNNVNNNNPYNPYININEPNESLPRKDARKHLTEELDINNIPINMDITFSTNTGCKVVLTIPGNTTIIQMCIMFMDRLGLQHNYIGNKINFFHNSKIINPFSNETIFNKFNNNVNIAVFIQDGVIYPETTQTNCSNLCDTKQNEDSPLDIIKNINAYTTTNNISAYTTSTKTKNLTTTEVSPAINVKIEEKHYQ